MSLYRDDILDHYHHPQNFGKPSVYTHSYEGANESCGDRQTVYLLVEDGVIQQAFFEGTGCVLSVASTSILTERLKGMPADVIRSLGEHDMNVLLGAEVMPGRMKCVMLGLRSFQKSLDSEESASPRSASATHEDAQIVTRNSLLGEIVERYPQAARIFTEYGLHCVGCFASVFDTVEAGALLHGMSDEEIEDMIKRANEEIAFHPEESMTEHASSHDAFQMTN